jgi:hypothetical protein
MKTIVCILSTLLCLHTALAFSATITYRQDDGKSIVSETYGTYIQNGASSKATAQVLETGGSMYYMLIRFPNIFGDGANQIPIGSTINSATLSLWTQYVSTSTAKTHTVHRMLVDWQETVTWSDLGYGGTPGTHYDATPFTTFTVYGGAPVEYTINVTSVLNGYSQQSYLNYGWYFIDTNLSWFAWWHSDDAASTIYRPLLSVDYTPPSIPEPPAVPEPLSIILFASCGSALFLKRLRK